MLAICLGFGLWSMVSTLHTDTTTITVPLLFYHIPEKNMMVPQHETITVTLKGPRAELQSIDYENLAVHINMQKMISDGGITLKPENLFLPNSIKVVRYTPMNLTTKNTLSL